MIEIGKTIISEDVFEKEFVCNLTACKGACCIEGDGGAPVLQEEIEELENALPFVKEYLSTEAIEILEKEGVVTISKLDGELETPLLKGKECVYTIFDKDGTAKCSIEKAFNDGKIEFKKPISCHLYPIRIKQLKEHEAINYDRWSICSDACKLGEELSVKVYEFLKEPLIRKFGEEWYAELKHVDAALKTIKK